MLCRYRCEHCDRWHTLGGIPTRELPGAWLSFVLDPPPPFDAKTWDMIIAAEMSRRQQMNDSTSRR